MTGQDVRDFRTRRGWTQADLARRLGVGRSWVAQIEAKAEVRTIVALAIRFLHTEYRAETGTDPR